MIPSIKFHKEAVYILIALRNSTIKLGKIKCYYSMKNEVKSQIQTDFNQDWLFPIKDVESTLFTKASCVLHNKQLLYFTRIYQILVTIFLFKTLIYE